MTPRGRRSRPSRANAPGAPPAGITQRVSSSCRTRITDNTLRRAGHLYLAGDAHCVARPSLRCPRQQWSRPVRIDVCSMFARTSWYAPALLGIRSAARMRAAGRSGSSWHVLALFDSSSRRISEQSSGLLIRGFGVRVPGGAPVLTWGFTAPGHFLCARFVPMFAPCLHACTDPAIRGLSKTAHPAPDAGACAPEPRRPSGRRRPAPARPMV